MGRNYKNYYKDNKKEEDIIDKPEIEEVNKEEVVEEVKNEEVVEEVKNEEVVEEVKNEEIKETKTNSNVGVVSNCSRLNVRKSPSKKGSVITIIDEGTIVEIDTDFINNNFYKVIVNNEIGYCMKEFIKLK